MGHVFMQRRNLIVIAIAALLLITGTLWWMFSSRGITWHTDHQVTAIALSMDGQWVAAAEEIRNELGQREDPLISVRHVPDGQVAATLVGHHLTIYSLAFSPDRTLLAAAGLDDHIRLWHLRDGRLAQIFMDNTTNSDIYRMTFSSDGQMLTSFSRDGTVRWWRVSDGQLLRTLALQHTEAMAFNETRQLLAARVTASTIQIWRSSDGQVITTINGFPFSDVAQQGGWDLAFSPDGRLLASVDDQWTIRLWRVDDGSLVATLSGHTDDIRRMVFSPDGRILASASGKPYLWLSEQKGSGDKTIRLWSVPDGRPLTTYTAHSNYILGLAFSPDGQWLVSGSTDTTIRLWKMK